MKKANRAVIRESMGNLKQERGETVRKFTGRIRALAVVSELEVECACTKKVSYMKEAIKDRVVGGLHDQDIKTAVLSHKDVNEWSLDDLLGYVEAKEAGRVSASLMGGAASASAVSSGGSSSYSSSSKGKPRVQQRSGCDRCGRSHGQDRGCPAKELKCFNCNMTGHFTAKCKKPRKGRENAKTVETKEVTEESVESVTDEKHWICDVSVEENSVFNGNKPFTILSDLPIKGVGKRRPLREAKAKKVRRQGWGCSTPLGSSW